MFINTNYRESIEVEDLGDNDLRNLIKDLANLIPGRCYTKDDYKNNLSELIDRLFFGK